jgi:O-antigen ligase
LISYSLAAGKWIYLGAVAIPFIIYICMKKPFIFPFGFYVFLIPFDEVLVITGEKRGPTVTKLLAVLVMLVMFLKGLFEKKFRKPDNFALWWVLFFLYGVFSTLWAINPGSVLSGMPTLIGLLFFYIIVSAYKVEEKEFETLKWFILAGGLLASLLTIYNYQSIDVTVRASLVIGEHEAALNSFAFSLLIPVSFCIEKILTQKRKLIKIVFGVLLGVIILCVVITGSRGAQLGVGVIFIVYILSIKSKITYGTVFIVIGIILFSLIPGFFMERWGEALESGGAGRTIIWQVGLKALTKYFMFGAGLSNFPEAYNEFMSYVPFYKGMSRASHNIYLCYWVELGIIGFSFMVIAIWKHYKAVAGRFSRDNMTPVMLKAALLGMLVSSFFLDSVWLKSFWLIFMMISMYGYLHKKVVYENIFSVMYKGH